MKPSLRQLAFAASLFLGHSTSALAQFSVGVKGGINLSNLAVKPSTEDGYQSRVAPNFALLFQYQLSPAFVLQAEPGFSMRGARLDSRLVNFEVNGASYDLQAKGYLKSGYLSLPVMAQYRPRLTDKLQAIISAGPEVLLLAGRMKSKIMTTLYENGRPMENQSEDRTLSSNDGIRSLDFGVATGAGLAFNLDRVSVFAEARYHWGLRSIGEKRPEIQTKIFNRGTSITLGVLFPIHQK